MEQHVNIKIFGLVQGVNFRYDSKRQADRLGLKGFVRNEPGGGVYLEVEGNSERVNDFLVWCQKGTFWSKIDKVEVNGGPMKNYPEFEILYA